MSANKWLPGRLVPQPVPGLLIGLVAGAGLGLGACDESRPGPATELATAVVSDAHGLAIEPSADAALAPSDAMGQHVPCAVAGTITIHGSLSTDEQRRATVWLGPGCRDIHVAR